MKEFDLRKLSMDDYMILGKLNEVFKLLEGIEDLIKSGEELLPGTNEALDQFVAIYDKWIAE